MCVPSRHSTRLSTHTKQVHLLYPISQQHSKQHDREPTTARQPHDIMPITKLKQDEVPSGTPELFPTQHETTFTATISQTNIRTLAVGHTAVTSPQCYTQCHYCCTSQSLLYTKVPGLLECNQPVDALHGSHERVSTLISGTDTDPCAKCTGPELVGHRSQMQHADGAMVPT